MAIDGCKHSFHNLASKVLPAHMNRMREAISQPHSMGGFGVTGIGAKTILKRLKKQRDFSGCYVLLGRRGSIYVGISRSVVQRLLGHVKGTDYYTATLAYKMARKEHGIDQTANEAMKDDAFMRRFAAKKDFLKTLHVAFIEIDDPIGMHLFEVYCAMELDTSFWNSFRTT